MTCASILSLFAIVVPISSFAQESNVTAPAVVRAKAEAEFSSSLSGTIEALPFEEGASFAEGDILVRLDCAAQRAEAAAAAADHQAARVESEARRALLSRGGIGRAQVAVAEAQTAAAEARQPLAEAVIGGCEITAPFEGRIVETYVNEFEYVQPSQPLLSTVSSERLELEINAPAVWLRWMDIGTEGKVRFEAVEDAFSIHVLSIGAAVDPVSATIKVTAGFQGDIPKILPGMSGLVSFE